MRRRHRAAHRRIWMALAIVLPVALLGALVLRPDGPREAPAVLLEGPGS